MSPRPSAPPKSRPAARRLPVLLALLVAPFAALRSAAADPAPPVAEYDLPRAVAEALATSPALRAAVAREDAATALSSEARAVRWPVLAARVSYDYASEVNRIDLPLGPTGTRTIEFGDGHTAVAALGVEMPVFTGGALAARAEAAAAGVRAAGFEISSDRLAVIRETRVAFFRALGAEAAARSASVAAQRLDRHRRQLERQVELGAASREALVQTLARLRQAEQRQLAAEEALDLARRELGRVIGRPGEIVAPRGDLDASLLEGLPVEAGDWEARPELSALAARLESADLEARAARGDYFPSVRAGAHLLHGRPGVEVVRKEWMSWGSAHVSLTWPLWDRGARSRRVERAEAMSRALDAERDSVHRRLEHAWAAARRSVESAEAQAAKADERTALERERLDLVTGRYERGMARETDLLDAHDDLAGAEADAAATRAALRRAEADLLYAASR
jgi:outer membrane protein